MDNLPLGEISRMIQQHNLLMKFLKDNYMITNDRKLKVVEKIEYTFQIIEGHSSESNRKRNHNDSVSSSSSNHKVSN